MTDKEAESVTLTRDELTSLLDNVEGKFKQSMDEREAKIKSDMEATFKEKLAAIEKKNKEEVEAKMQSLKQAPEAKKPEVKKPAGGGISRKAALLSAAAALKAEQAAEASKPEQARAPSPGNSASVSFTSRNSVQVDAEVDVDDVIEKRSSHGGGATAKQSALLAGAVGKLMVQKKEDGEEKPEKSEATKKLAGALGALMKDPNGNSTGGESTKFGGAIAQIMKENRAEKRKEGGLKMSFADVVEDVMVEQKLSAIAMRNAKKISAADAAFRSRSSMKLMGGSFKEEKKVESDEEDDDEDEDDMWHAPFGETIYTLVYMCPPDSQAFWYSIFVYSLQFTTVLLTLIDIVDVQVNNVLQLPPMVDLTVTVAQGVTLFLVLGYMSDLLEAVIKLQDGFYPEVLEVHPGATYGTWLVSCLAQLSSGILVLVGSFILTMQASTVIDLMLNLTALLFISEIDDLGFLIAKLGFVNDTIQQQAEAVACFEVPIREKKNRNRRILYALTLAGLMIGYGALKQRQLDGTYLQSFVYVQFGDAYNPKIPYFSGILSSGNKRTSGYREYRDLGTNNILLTFCKAQRAWTFTDNGDPCTFFAKANVDQTYDVTTLPDASWGVVDGVGRLQPFDTFSLVGRDCLDNICQGTCVDGLCQCPHDRFGMDCEFADVCPELVLDGRTKRLPAVFSDDSDFVFLASDSFEILKHNGTGDHVRVYNMPVYYSTQLYPASILFFGGRRWVITSEDGFLNFTETQAEEPGKRYFPEKTAEKFVTEFHGYESAKYRPFFLSDPVDYETPLFRPSPSGLGWWSVATQNETARFYAPDAKVDTFFNCLRCNAGEEGFCGIGGACNETSGLCECYPKYTGMKCEMLHSCDLFRHPCYGDGVCDKQSGACTCNKPYADRQCAAFFACYEEDGVCQNGGECEEIGLCNCPDDPDLTGLACEKFADCHVHGCANGGVCALNGKCVCREPYHGVRCNILNTTLEEALCKGDDDCANGACNVTSGICDCEDPSSFGALCEHEYHCSWGGCANNGVCNEESGICECQEPYFGPDCQSEPNCLDDSNYCEAQYGYGSACDAAAGGCRCSWPYFFPGKKCVFNCKADGQGVDGCFNGGFCNMYGNCECSNPYSGNYCDYLTVDVDTTWQNFLGEKQACVDEHGWPPYADNETDCTVDYPGSGGRV